MNGHTLVADFGLTVGVTGKVPSMSALPASFLNEDGTLGINRDGGQFGGLMPPTPAEGPGTGGAEQGDHAV